MAAEPAGYVVAGRTSEGHWVMDSIGIWPTIAEAEADRADLLRDAHPDDTETFFVCAVTPVSKEGE